MKTRYYLLLFIFFMMAAPGCRMPGQLPSAKPQVPVVFGNDSAAVDTATAASISWRAFFTDKYLVKLIDSALQHNFDVQAAYQRIAVYRSDVLLARGALLPVVDAGVGGSMRRFGLYTMDGAGNATTEIKPGKLVPVNLPDYYIGLQAAWEIDIWGKYRNARRAAQARLLASVEGRNAVITGLIADIASSYYQLVALDRTVATIDENIALQEKSLRMATIQKQAARVNELAVQQFGKELMGLQALRRTVTQQVHRSENALNFLCGRYGGVMERDTAFLSDVLPVQVKTGVPALLLQNRPDVRQAELELMAARADIRAAKAAFYPNINITGSGGLQAFEAGLLFKTPESLFFGLFGNLTAPLINRAPLKSGLNRRIATGKEAVINFHRAVMAGYFEVYNEMQAIKASQDVYEMKVKEMAIVSQAVKTSLELFRTARASYLEVLIARQNALDVQLELINVRKEQLDATIALYRALGGGWR